MNKDSERGRQNQCHRLLVQVTDVLAEPVTDVSNFIIS